MTRLAVVLLACSLTTASVSSAGPGKAGNRLSAMGELAHARIKALRVAGVSRLVPGGGETQGEPLSTNCADGNKACIPGQPAGGMSGTQSETSIAVDSTGQHIVIGFNDFRGFVLNPPGYMYSDDGGATFHDGGQLPTPGNQVIGTIRFPQVFGDPDVKYLGGCNFIYTSLVLKVVNKGVAQTLGVHRSTDCGHTWTGPFEIPAATNPNGKVDVNGDAEDAADKELVDVDPDTAESCSPGATSRGRLLEAWRSPPHTRTTYSRRHRLSHLAG
jgi:hypothetical protein